MTDFDLGDPAPDADEEPDEPEESEESVDQPDTESEHFENVGPDPSEVETPDEEPVRERDPTETGPAFPYSEVKQSPLYAHEDVWTEFEDQIDRSVVPDLRDMEIRDDELREIHTVALEIVLDNLEEIPERLAERRRRS